jgi:hypothetical protein
MSEQTGILDDTGQPVRKEGEDVLEPLVRHMRDRPISTGLIILVIGFVLGKML